MKVFLTGSTGWVGSAIVPLLLQAGHQVTGLVRSEANAQLLAQMGAKVLLGNIEDLESLRRGVKESDGIIHTAFNHDFSKFKENAENDRKAIEAMGAAIGNSGKPFVVTSGTALVSPGQVADEDGHHKLTSKDFPRVASEEAADAVADLGVRCAVVRLAPTVHGDGDHGFIPMLINIAREKGVSAYVGEGKNRWNAVHRFDAAKLYCVALEQAAPGERYHGAAEGAVPFREIAEAIGKGLKIPVESISPEQAVGHFGFLSAFAGLDCPVSSQLTQERLGWKPTGVGIIRDLIEGKYFQ